MATTAIWSVGAYSSSTEQSTWRTLTVRHLLRSAPTGAPSSLLSSAPGRSLTPAWRTQYLHSVRHVARAAYIRRRFSSASLCFAFCWAVGPVAPPLLLCSVLLCSLSAALLRALLGAPLLICSLFSSLLFSALLRALLGALLLALLCSSVRYWAHSCGRVRPQQKKWTQVIHTSCSSSRSSRWRGRSREELR